MELVVLATAHRLKYILKAPPESCDWGQSCPATLSFFPAVCSRGKLRTFVSAVFYFKIAVIFNHLIITMLLNISKPYKIELLHQFM